MDEQKTDDLQEFFDLNQEQAEEDEKNESRNEDVDRGIREQAASQFVSVPQCCTTHTPGGKVKIAIAPGKTDITPYMASLGIISLEAYMELEAQKKTRENVNTTQETKRAEREAEFMQSDLMTKTSLWMKNNHRLSLGFEGKGECVFWVDFKCLKKYPSLISEGVRFMDTQCGQLANCM
uniref:Uncharacterized protein n=1 Tax=Magallana gigas TaxID=29159 RepID=A0A8W8JDR0_MAGGI